MEYNFKEIEQRWQQYWANKQTFKVENHSNKPKYYVLDMFPYPSGAGLHVGHPLGYIASDIYARYKRLKGFNVLHPAGYDSFGLPAEQYAIQTGQHPAITTETNINTYRKQLDKIGFSFDWSREVRTSDPSYYKWTQWIFLQLFNAWYNNDTHKAEKIETLIEQFKKEGNTTVNAACDENVISFSAEEWNAFSKKQQEEILLQYRLTYLADTEVNWCPALGTVLANDEIVNGVSERGGYPVIRKKMTQWSMRISAYAERLLQGLEQLDWTDALKESQRNWIGKSQGASVEFGVQNSEFKIEVFTTRPDTIFGVTFMTLAPEHELVQHITTPEYKEAVQQYIEETSKRSERDRMADVKTISGQFTGAYAIHPFTGEEVPIWIGDYVLASYGTGAVMAVPCGDERDYAFSKHFNIPIKNIFADIDISEEAYTAKEGTIKIANSDFLDGLTVKKATKLAIYEIEQRGFGKGKTNYRLRDAVFSRQRYWGEPFPVYYKDGMPQMVDAKHLPVVLPEVEKYLPTEDGDPPLGRADIWAWDTNENTVVSNQNIDHKTVFPLELNTMPGWAGSSWYFNRYMDAQNTEAFASQEALNYWKDVDLYIGGSEHATGHLLYSRFWQKFLFDLNYVPVDEFAKKLINQGMILGNSAFVYRINDTNQFVSLKLKDQYETTPIHTDVTFVNGDILDIEKFKNWRPDFKDAEFILEDDGTYRVGFEVEKMSKSKYNVLNPDDICNEYGADSLRMYEMFLGPIDQAKPWNTNGLSGVYGFLKKFWKLFFENSEFNVQDSEPTKEEMKILHTAIKKVDEDIQNFSFNTSVSTFMIATNDLLKLKCNKRAILEPLTILLSPYAPHIAEELWSKLGYEESISFANFPVFEKKWLVESSKEYPVSFNGKMRFKIELPLDMPKDEMEKVVMADERTQKYLDGREPKKIIIVPGKIINIVG
ncbi:leucine--tRNA ligase [Flavobacteriaceae bacterium UJ101]|nr:leucine--tRNA ligase [Flavobacteriaceae bacterium UJ101]